MRPVFSVYTGTAQGLTRPRDSVRIGKLVSYNMLRTRDEYANVRGCPVVARVCANESAARLPGTCHGVRGR